MWRAVRWSEDGQAVPLGTVAGSTSTLSVAASTNGEVIAGHVYFGGPHAFYHAFRWTTLDGMIDLGAPAGSDSCQVLAMNGTGSAMVGYSSGFFGDTRAFLWSESLGMVDLNSYLPTLGIDLTNWTLTQATGVSDDGFTLTGRGSYDEVPGPGGAIGLSWVVTIPSPSAGMLGVIAGVVAAPGRRRR